MEIQILDFFHSLMKQRFRRNGVVHRLTRRGLISRIGEIKEEIKVHFQDRFQEPWSNRPKLIGVNFNHLNTEDVLGLEEQFCVEEIKEVDIPQFVPSFNKPIQLS